MENLIVWESRQENIRRSIPKPLVFYGPQRNPNEPPRYLYNDLFFLKNGNTKEKKYILSLYKIHAKLFPEADLEEKINHWVPKEFKNFNKDARLLIQHWKESWHKRLYKQNRRKVRDNPEDYISNHKIKLYYKDDSCWSADLKSKTTEDIMKLHGSSFAMRFNGRKYILVIVDDFSRFTWVKFLRSKDEVPEFVIKFLKMIKVRLNAIVRNIRTDNGTEFVNQTLRDYYEEVRVSHQTSVARTPQLNGIVERRNRTLVEAA
ncbi:retrovirus-related pol polyprotein from transposon TNT 1-94 [Tanacetum coccineum]